MKGNLSTGTRPQTPSDEERRTIEVNHVVDRSGWPAGPWDKEPEDRAQWAHGGLACLAVRNSSGYWCGYVGIPEGHPALLIDRDLFDVHGGITYGPAPCDGGIICHVPEPGMPHDVQWLGFDCAHFRDGYPTLNRRLPRKLHIDDLPYRDFAFVRSETESLARQIAALAQSQAPEASSATLRDKEEAL